MLTAWFGFLNEPLLHAPSLAIALPEDLIIFKAVAWRPQDKQDVERLLALHGSRVDIDRIRRHVKELGEALEVDRLRDLDALVARIVRR